MSETAPAAAAPAPKAGKSHVMMIVVVALVVASGAGAGAFWYARRSAPVVVEKIEHAGDRGLVTFEPFVVNLADANASRFLRISVQLVVKNEEEAERIQKKPALLMGTRSAILEVLTTQTSDTLATPAGKAALKKAIAEHAGAALDDTKVID